MGYSSYPSGARRCGPSARSTSGSGAASFAAASGIRLGTQEMTRFGMNEADFGELAELLAGILREPHSADPGSRREKVIRFRQRFTRMRYCL